MPDSPVAGFYNSGLFGTTKGKTDPHTGGVANAKCGSCEYRDCLRGATQTATPLRVCAGVGQINSAADNDQVWTPIHSHL
jgi:hypothetical protein